MPNRTDERFGMLLVFYDAGPVMFCRCDCGFGTMALRTNLTGGNTKSCGCLRARIEKVASVTHGASTGGRWRRTYSIWHAMIQRCCNPNNPSFHRYGGRGIVVSEPWRSYEAFAVDMGIPPTRLHTLDRSNNNGPYSKANCQWATNKQKQRNRRDNIMLSHNGKTQPMSAWAEELNRPYFTLHSQYKRGWTAAQMLGGTHV